MRTIKFKAKRLSDGEWVKGDLLQYIDITSVPVLIKKTNENAIIPSKAHDDDF